MTASLPLTATSLMLVCLLVPVTSPSQARLSKLDEARQKARAAQSRIVGRACFLPDGPLDCMRTEITELRATVRDYTLWKLNDSRGDIKQLVDDLSSIDEIYVREAGIGGINSRAQTFQQDTTTGPLLITINYFSAGGMALPYGVVIIQGFRNQGGRWVFGAETGESVSGIMDYHPLELLQSPVSSEMWLLIGGQVAGFMGHLDRVRVYAFNGHEFRELWKPEDRQDMDVTVKGNEIRATYLGPRIKRFPGYYQDHMEETLQLTPSGVLQTLLPPPPKPASPYRRAARRPRSS